MKVRSPKPPPFGEGRSAMALVKRFALAIGSLVALVIAGGAHVKI